MVPFCLIWTFESLLESDSNPILPTLWGSIRNSPANFNEVQSTSNCFNIPVPNKISPLFSSIAAEKEPDFGTPFPRKSCRRAWLACSFEPVARSRTSCRVSNDIRNHGTNTPSRRIKNYQKVQTWQKIKHYSQQGNKSQQLRELKSRQQSSWTLMNLILVTAANTHNCRTHSATATIYILPKKIDYKWICITHIQKPIPSSKQRNASAGKCL